MSAHRIVVVETEKSPKVCSTNWKEDVVLKRNLQVLDRSQRTVINRIVVDQKILNRRFQTKRSRSKMSWARATGNVEMQKRLREKTTFVLNTNVGHKEEDDDTLRRIWEKGRAFYTKRLEADALRKKKTIGAFTCIKDDTRAESAPRKKEENPMQSIKGANMRSDIMVTIDKYYVQKPASAPTDQRTVYSNDDQSGGAPIVVEDFHNANEETMMRPQTAFVTASEDDTKTRDIGKGTKKARPSTAGGFLRTMTDILEPCTRPPLPRTAPARQNATRPVTTNAGIGSMFEPDEFQISLLDFQRFRVDSAKYESRVKNYAQSIKALKMDKARAIDYYTTRLEAETGHCKRSFKMEAARDATTEDIKRATGNLKIRSLTLKSIIPV